MISLEHKRALGREAARRYRLAHPERHRAAVSRSRKRGKESTKGLSTLEVIGDSNVFWQKVDVGDPDDCWEFNGTPTDKRGYCQFALPRGRRVLAHRAAWELVNGEIGPGLFVCHHCDNPSCCNPLHLFVGTPKDNTQDAIKKGRQRRYFAAKLTPDQVGAIFSDTRPVEEIINQYGIDRSQIFRIRSRNAWQSVTNALPDRGG